MIDYNYAIIFINPDNIIHHIVWVEELPNIATLNLIFDELLNDNDFGINDKDFIDSLKVHITYKNDLFELNENFKELYPLEV